MKNKILILAVLFSFRTILNAAPYYGPYTGGSSAGVETTNIIDTTALTLSTLYTNTSGSNLVVRVSIVASASDAAALAIDNNHDGSFETMFPVQYNSEANSPQSVSGDVLPNGIYEVQVAGGSPVIGACQRVYSPIAQVVVSGVASPVPATQGLVSSDGTKLVDSGVNPTNVTQFGTNVVVDVIGSSSVTVSATTNSSGIHLTVNVSPNVVTNYATTVPFSSMVITNGTFGDFSINRGNVGAQLNTFGGDVYIGPKSGHGVAFMYSGDGTSSKGWDGQTMNYTAQGGVSSGGRHWRVNSFDFPSTTAAGLWSNAKPVSDFIPFPAGSASTLDDLPIQGDEIAPAMTTPPIVISTWSGVSLVMNEQNVTNYIYQATTNGFFAAMTNAGAQPWLHLDVNARFLTNSRTGTTPGGGTVGELAINTAFFPSGTNFINTLHSNGWDVALTIYGYYMPTNQVLLNDFTGVIGTGPDAYPAMTPNSIRQDVTTFYSWGIDGLRFSDGGPTGIGYFNMFSLGLVNAILTPTRTNGGTGAINYPWYDSYSTGETKRPMSLWFLTPGVGQNSPMIHNRINLHLVDSYNSPYYIAGDSPYDATMRHFRATFYYEVPYLTHSFSEGQTFFGDEASDVMQAQLSMCAMNKGAIQCSWQTNSSMNATFPILLPLLTNSFFLSIHQDKRILSPKLLYDTGVSNTFACYRELQNHNYAVFLANETASTSNLTFSTWSFINDPTNTTWQAFDVFGGTNIGGVFTGNFTITNMPATSTRLLKLYRQ